MKKIFKITVAAVFTLIMTVVSTDTFANDDFGDNVQDTPIDGGVSLLLAAGAAYGAKKLHESRSKKNKLN